MLNLKLIQNHILLENPFKPREKSEGGIILSPADKKAAEEEDMKKIDRMKVVKAGIECKLVKEGDEVLVMLERIIPDRNPHAYKVFDGKSYILIRENDVIAIYDRGEAKSDLFS